MEFRISQRCPRTWSTANQIAEASAIPTEGHTMAPEPHTKATQRCEFVLSSLPAGHTMTTQRRVESRMRSK